MLQQGSAELQLFVGRGKFRRSLRNLLIKFVGDNLLSAQEPSLLHGDGRLIRSYVQEKSFGLQREIRPLRPCYEQPNFTMQPES